VSALNFKVTGRDENYPAVFMSNGEMSLTLWQTDENSIEFNRKLNVGLHHLAIQVTSFEALEELHKALQKHPGVVIEFAPEFAYGGPAKHMMIREPSGNRLELVHRP
jgi:lactoylglutathione lyase